MPVTLDELSGAIHGFFAQKLGGVSGEAPGSVVLVFDGLGSPLSPKEFGAGGTASQQQLLAHQRAAQLADQLPAANGLANGWYLPRSGARLSLWYRALLNGSVPVSGSEEAIKNFESRKADALKRLELNELVEIGGLTADGPGVNPTGVHDKNFATGMSPVDWFLPDSDAWEACRFDGTQPAQPTPTPIPVPFFDAHVLIVMPANPDPERFFAGGMQFFHSAGETVSEGELFATLPFIPREPFGDSVSVDIPAPATGTILKRVFSADGLEPGDQLAIIGVRRAPAVRAPRMVVNMPDIDKPLFISRVHLWHKAVGDVVALDELLVEIRFDAPITGDIFDFQVRSPVAGRVLQIDKPNGASVEPGTELAVIATDATEEAPQGFSVEFDSCIVMFNRPWWDDVFIASSNWLVSGFTRGQIASGTVASPASAAITLVTAGIVVVRNLRIASNWAEQERDQLTSGALNLGPFSLTGADVSGQTLTRPGMQALGWICQVPPVLPPTADPALPPT